MKYYNDKDIKEILQGVKIYKPFPSNNSDEEIKKFLINIFCDDTFFNKWIKTKNQILKDLKRFKKYDLIILNSERIDLYSKHSLFFDEYKNYFQIKIKKSDSISNLIDEVIHKTFNHILDLFYNFLLENLDY